ncbi:class I adenylate-forming enzyme family protein [Serratia rubidaea]|uniref:class I adenylate-forming enzyme family protein n=1 Tax=Serratia rubidaea TaxID=61652 RepID=UPI001BB02D28|nr:class I adenylate-forming enzyme family protein [Serratia rubidaea]MBS0972849.1 acyl--CoA ligase [Serratia rubidaea]
MVQTPATLDATLRRMASEQPQRILLTDARDPDAPMDYRWGETDQLVNGLARQLAQQPGDAVGVLLDNSYRCLCLIYAVMRAGKDLVLIDPEWGQAAKRAIIDEMSLRVLAGNITLHDEFAGLQVPLDFAPLPAGEQAPDRAAQSRMILFTSGTTGKPKGIVLSQQAMVSAYAIGQRCLQIGEHTRAGCFYRVSGLGILGINFLFPLLYGGSVVLLPLHCWAESDDFWRYVDRFAITFLYMVPPIVNFMVKEGTPPPHPYRLERLLCVAGSARLDAEAQRLFQQHFAPLANIYGLSECGFAFLFGRRQGELFDNSVGPAVGLSLRLTDESGAPLNRPGARGRLWVKTPSLFSGYINQPALTAQVLQDGWLDTQDVAFFDAQGGVHVLGRADGTINKGGNLFHLNECEQLLNGREDVVDACCLKVPCDVYGEDYIAVIQSSGQERQALTAWLELQLGTQRAPRTVVCLSQSLPLNGAGKHDRKAIAALIGQEVV